jgi:hypothetical protein
VRELAAARNRRLDVALLLGAKWFRPESYPAVVAEVKSRSIYSSNFMDDVINEVDNKPKQLRRQLASWFRDPWPDRMNVAFAEFYETHIKTILRMNVDKMEKMSAINHFSQLKQKFFQGKLSEVVPLASSSLSTFFKTQIPNPRLASHHEKPICSRSHSTLFLFSVRLRLIIRS